MTEPRIPPQMFPIDLDGAPAIMLGGKPWKIPKLAHAQNKIVVPLLAGVMPRLMSALTAMQSGDETAILRALDVLDGPTYEALGTVVFTALKRGYPQIGAGEFEQFPIEPMELLAALPRIMSQSGFFKPSRDPAPGEVAAAPVVMERPAAPSTGQLLTGTALSSVSPAPPAGSGNT